MGVSSSNLLRSTNFGDIAQLARASALQAEGRRFDSVYLHLEASELSEASFLYKYQQDVAVRHSGKPAAQGETAAHVHVTWPSAEFYNHLAGTNSSRRDDATATFVIH